VILLDHNIPEGQTEQLGRWNVRFRQIGHDVGRPEWDDQQEILRYLHRAKRATLFTRDADFFHAKLIHPNYCLVVIDTPVLETATTIRELLRHPNFRTKALRCGKIIKITTRKITYFTSSTERHQLYR